MSKGSESSHMLREYATTVTATTPGIHYRHAIIMAPSNEQDACTLAAVGICISHRVLAGADPCGLHVCPGVGRGHAYGDVARRLCNGMRGSRVGRLPTQRRWRAGHGCLLCGPHSAR